MDDKKPVVLIVDDMATNISVLVGVLGSAYRIKIALKGKKAIELALSEDKPDLILLDIEMPELDGYEVLKILKSDARTISIPVIFVTARSDVQDEEQGFNLGAVDYITKPFHASIVQARVRNQINLKLKSDKLEELSMMDGLTRIPNRRYFDETFAKEFKESVRYGKPISVIMIDIDFFKAYNDNYGHGRGDLCLMEVAKILQNTLKRPTDFIARYGGEEFVAVLPSTDMQGAFIIAQNFLQAVRDIKLLHEFSSVSKYLTISAGVASMEPSTDASMQELLSGADKALYLAKNNGRNQVAKV